MWQSSYDGKPTLYLVPTPIGNLDDMTYRSIKILGEVSVIFSEDTRVTSILLNHFLIKKKLISLHEHNEEVVKTKVVDFLKKGESVALVTDRGTPIISDPGYKTVKAVSECGFNVVALPGACAFVPALIVSGISSQPFLFYGFLNSKEGHKKKELSELKYVKSTIIFYEAPHRIFGDRNISLSREISKRFESVYRGSVSNLLNCLGDIKGEYVIVIEGYNDDNSVSELSILDNVNLYINNGMDTMDAIKRVARERKVAKSIIYGEYHKGR